MVILLQQVLLVLAADLELGHLFHVVVHRGLQAGELGGVLGFLVQQKFFVALFLLALILL